MRIQAILFTLALSYISFSSIAGSNHDHGYSHDTITQQQAEDIATKNVARLADKDKIDKSWKSTRISTSEQKKFGGKTEWVITFNNKNVQDSAKQTLYIFLSLAGEYLAANYSGK
ncbi:hypothetical protein JYT26_01080 [Beggiatoa alba]|nr:hypothetical protein [Beggiatoa alba]